MSPGTRSNLKAAHPCPGEPLCESHHHPLTYPPNLCIFCGGGERLSPKNETSGGDERRTGHKSPFWNLFWNRERWGRMLNLAYSDVDVFWMPLELVPEIPVNATPEHHQGKKRDGPGPVRGRLGVKQSGAPRRARPSGLSQAGWSPSFAHGSPLVPRALPEPGSRWPLRPWMSRPHPLTSGGAPPCKTSLFN